MIHVGDQSINKQIFLARVNDLSINKQTFPGRQLGFSGKVGGGVKAKMNKKYIHYFLLHP